MTEKIIISLISLLSGVLVTIIGAAIKIRQDRKKSEQEFKLKLANLQAEGTGVKEISKQFAIGLLVVTDPEHPDSIEKILVPPHTKMTVGRDPENDVVVYCPYTSRNHILISSNQSNIFVEDLLSTNQTFINGSPISKTTQLSNGDEISFGDAKIIYKSLTK